MAISPTDRDIVIKTILGEAANEGPDGWAGVAWSIKNRLESDRSMFKGETPGQIAKQRSWDKKRKRWVYQYSAWNDKNFEGNDNVKIGGGKKYDAIGKIVDGVFGGNIPDPTGGATHYYAPKAMSTGRAPYWWGDESRIGGGQVRIGNHVFAGNPEQNAAIQTAMLRDPGFYGGGARPTTTDYTPSRPTMVADVPIPRPRPRPDVATAAARNLPTQMAFRQDPQGKFADPMELWGNFIPNERGPAAPQGLTGLAAAFPTAGPPQVAAATAGDSSVPIPRPRPFVGTPVDSPIPRPRGVSTASRISDPRAGDWDYTRYPSLRNAAINVERSPLGKVFKTLSKPRDIRPPVARPMDIRPEVARFPKTAHQPRNLPIPPAQGGSPFNLLKKLFGGFG